LRFRPATAIDYRRPLALRRVRRALRALCAAPYSTFRHRLLFRTLFVRVGTEISGGTEIVTDVNGRYTLPQPPHTGQPYYFTVNDTLIGRGYPVGEDYRGDLLVNPGTCVSRYGVVIDTRTLQPLAEVSLAILTNTLATTRINGWYRIDWGCPASGWVGFNTTFLRASHPNYHSHDALLGRGISGSQRLDFILSAK
jgi:hypothetical protein